MSSILMDCVLAKTSKEVDAVTVNCHYCRHSRDRELVSSIERVQQEIAQKKFRGDLAAVRISRVSVKVRCPQGES